MTQDIRTGICSLPRETISLICWNVAPGKYHGTAPGNLLSLARSCRFLSEPALDIIWNTLPSIWPLLLLLPEDLCEFRHIEGLDPEDPQTEFEYVQRFRYGRTKLDFRREPTPADFALWIKYSARVRRISASAMRMNRRGTPTPVLTLGLVDKLQAHCPKPFLPNIRVLRHFEGEFSGGDRDSVVLPASLHFSHSLKKMSLALALHPDPNHLRDIVKSLSLLDPRIEQLSLRRGGTPDRGYADFASQYYRPTLRGVETCALSCLTSFTTGRMFVAYDALLGLGRLPHLRKLHIDPSIDSDDWAPAVQGPRRNASFVALEELVLTGKEGNHQGCIDFVGIITPTSLNTVTLDLRWPKDGTAEALFAALCAALGGLPCHGTIKTINITLGSRDDVDGNIYHSPCFVPLLQLHALQSLSIEGGPKVVVDDAMLDAMSHAWPDIRTLQFVWPPSPRLDWWAQEHQDRIYTPPGTDVPDRPRATLAGLVPLALRCRHLAQLKVAIDMRVVPTFDGQSHPPVFIKDPTLACQVKELCTEGCVPGDPWAVASFLSLVLPLLEPFGGTPPRATWERTHHLYRWLRALRFQERDWAINHRKAIKDPACF